MITAPTGHMIKQKILTLYIIYQQRKKAMAGSIPLHCSSNNMLDRNDKSEHTPQLGECSSDYHCLSGGFIPDISVSPPESNLLRWPSIQKRWARERTDDVLLSRRNKNTSEQSILYSDVSCGINSDIFLQAFGTQRLSLLEAWWNSIFICLLV